MPTSKKKPVVTKEESINDIVVLAILFNAYYQKLGNTEVALSNAEILLESFKNRQKS